MEEFFSKYQKSVLKFVSRKIDDADVVEEVVDDILMAAYKSLPTFNKKCSEFSFICAIANHKIVDYYRKKKIKTILFSTNPIFEDIADMAIGPERDCLKNELKDEIGKTFDEIGEGYKKILRLKYIDGLRNGKIAQLLKISIKAVESRIVRAKRQFQEKWSYDKKEAWEYRKIDGIDRD